MSISAEQARFEMSRLYISTFNRVPDGDGLAYWTDLYYRGVSLSAIASGFMGSAEGIQKYPVGLSVGDFIDRIYQNVLSRVPDAGGKAYWQTLFDAGYVTRATFIDTIISAAVANGSNDGKILNNKATFGVNVALSGVDVDSATAALSSITADVSSIVDAASVSLNLSFTTGQDNFVGGNGNDVFNASSSTSQSTDTVSGGGGIDTLIMQGGTVLPQMSSIETIKLINTAGSVGIGSSSGVATVYIVSPVGLLSLSTAASIIKYQNIDSAYLQNILLTSTATTLNVSLDNVGGSETSKADFDISSGSALSTLALSTTGQNSYMVLSNSALSPLSAIVITGSSDLYLDISNANIASANNINASSFAANLTLVLNDTLDKNYVITGGTRDDVIYMGGKLTASDVIDGKGGMNTLKVGLSAVSTTDAKLSNVQNIELTTACDLNLSGQTENFTISGSGSTDSIVSGSGNDVINAGSGNDVVSGGSGNDTITLGGGEDIARFEATYALNGIDTITDFVPGEDRLDFSGFLTTTTNTSGAAIPALAASTLSAGLDLTGYNIGVLSGAANGEVSAINISTLVSTNKITIADNTKAVVLSKASDSSATCYVYFIEDSNSATTAQTWSVKLVGILQNNSAYGVSDMANSGNFI